VAADGSFTIAWLDRQHPFWPLVAQRYNRDGVAQGEPLVVADSISRTSGIDAGPDGTFIVAWAVNVNSRDVVARRFNAAGVPQGEMLRVHTGTWEGQAGVTSVAGNGDFVVVWNDANDVFARKYVLDVPPTSSGISDVTVDLGAPDTLIDLRSVFADLRDSDAQLIFSVMGNSEPALFSAVSVDPAAGSLRLNYSDARVGTATLVVRATDSSGLSVDAEFDVTVQPVIGGTPGADAILVRRAGDAVQVFVNAAGGATPSYQLPLAGLPPLRVSTGDGQDTFTLDLAGGNPLPAGGMTFDGGQGLTSVQLTGAGSVGVGSSAAAGRLAMAGDGITLHVDAGALAVLHDVLQLKALRINGGLLEIGNGALFLHDSAADAAARAAALAQALGQVRSGRGAGDWTGTSGITSSAAKGDIRRISGVAVLLNDRGDGTPLLTSHRGQSVPAGAVIVSYAVNGDTDLSGAVNADDYMRVDRGFLDGAGGGASTGWGGGDFNHDGRINISDYFLIDAAFSMQEGSGGVPAGMAGGQQSGSAPAPVLPAIFAESSDLFDPPLEGTTAGEGLDFDGRPADVLGAAHS
jgi:hypothetical protein